MTQLRDRMLEELERRNYAPEPREPTCLRSSSLPSTFIVLPTGLARSISGVSALPVSRAEAGCKDGVAASGSAAVLLLKTLKRHHMLEHLPFPRLPEKLRRCSPG